MKLGAVDQRRTFAIGIVLWLCVLVAGALWLNDTPARNVRIVTGSYAPLDVLDSAKFTLDGFSIRGKRSAFVSARPIQRLKFDYSEEGHVTCVPEDLIRSGDIDGFIRAAHDLPRLSTLSGRELVVHRVGEDRPSVLEATTTDAGVSARVVIGEEWWSITAENLTLRRATIGRESAMLAGLAGGTTGLEIHHRSRGSAVPKWGIRTAGIKSRERWCDHGWAIGAAILDSIHFEYAENDDTTRSSPNLRLNFSAVDTLTVRQVIARNFSDAVLSSIDTATIQIGNKPAVPISVLRERFFARIIGAEDGSRISYLGPNSYQGVELFSISDSAVIADRRFPSSRGEGKELQALGIWAVIFAALIAGWVQAD